MRIEKIGPRVLATTFSDQTQALRVKSSKVYRRWTESWELSRDNMRVLMDFFDLMGLHTTFTRLALDPQSGDNFTTTLAQVRFDRTMTPEQIGPQWYAVTVVQRETEL